MSSRVSFPADGAGGYLFLAHHHLAYKSEVATLTLYKGNDVFIIICWRGRIHIMAFFVLCYFLVKVSHQRRKIQITFSLVTIIQS